MKIALNGDTRGPHAAVRARAWLSAALNHSLWQPVWQESRVSREPRELLNFLASLESPSLPEAQALHGEPLPGRTHRAAL